MQTLDVMFPEIARQEYEEKIREASAMRRFSNVARAKHVPAILRAILSLVVGL